MEFGLFLWLPSAFNNSKAKLGAQTTFNSCLLI